jgi:hypothetical protein
MFFARLPGVLWARRGPKLAVWDGRVGDTLVGRLARSDIRGHEARLRSTILTESESESRSHVRNLLLFWKLNEYRRQPLRVVQDPKHIRRIGGHKNNPVNAEIS